jgi:lysophospholipase L1-like esterase
MRTRGRLVSCLVTMVLALGGFVTAGVLPAAATPSIVPYVALGDSYAAGTAAGSFPNCPHGPAGYPTLLDDAESRIVLPDQDNVTCSGATTSEVADHQLSALDRDTRLVTLTVGAANLGLSAVAAACVGGTLPDCLAAIEPAQRELGDCPGGESTLGGRLIVLYGEVAKAAPSARIVVTGYPLLFEPPADADPVLAAKITAINEATAKLNCVIERAVAAANDADVNIHYVDVTEEFAGHGIAILDDVPPCTDPSAFIHSLLICDPPPPRSDPEAFHPTAAGYLAYADAISASLPGGWLKQEPLA